MMPFPWRLLGAVALLLAAFVAGWRVNGWRWEAREAERIEQTRITVDAANARADKLAAEFEAFKARGDDEKQEIVREVTKIVDRPVYRDRDCLDADGVRVINRAAGRAGPGPAGQPAPAVPASADPR